MTRLDVKKVINKFGGTRKLQHLFKENGYTVTDEAIAKWRERGMIPMPHWLNLVSIDPGLDIRKYIR